MLCDLATYSSDTASSQDEEEDAIREGLRRGDLKITFHGERLHGSFALIRMKFAREASSSAKPQWLMIKHRDQFATDEDVVAENMTSVDSGRTMEEIASGTSRVWRANREPKASKTKRSSRSAEIESADTGETSSESQAKLRAPSLEPMYASIGSEIPGSGWTLEPTYDGIASSPTPLPTTSSSLPATTRTRQSNFPKSLRR